MTILTPDPLAPDTLISPALAGSAVPTTHTGRTAFAGRYRPKARATFIAPLPKAGRHAAVVAAPGLLVGVAGATLTAAALMIGLGR